MENINELLDDLKDVEDRNQYLRFQLYEALQERDIEKAAKAYNLINEGEIIICEITPVIENYVLLN